MNPALFVGVAAKATTNTNPLVTFLPLILIGVVFYFLLIRPQQRRARAQRELIQSVDVGDEVVTIGGLHGTILALDDETATIEAAPGVQLKFLRGAIARTLVEEPDYQPSEDEEACDQS